MDAIARTPQQSPSRRVPSITQAQKQALVDNLQLEITERARKLRAQYALQAQGLRARLELRVNRIPQALRKRNIQELIDEHQAKSKPAPPPPMPVVAGVPTIQAAQPVASKAKPALKRKSDEISTGDDKENMPAQSAQDIPNPKKRTKTVVAANSKATRARNAGPAGVLSPRSHNSRNLPQSPLKPLEKTYPPRPMSSAQTVSKPTRAPSRQTKRPETAPDIDGGRISEGSNTSAGTTIITKPGTRKAATTKKTVPGRPATTTKKTAAAKSTTAPPAATRTLRSRNQ